MRARQIPDTQNRKVKATALIVCTLCRQVIDVLLRAREQECVYNSLVQTIDF